jgi:glycosyltransferase involved in cell wall biosynthesis
VSVFFQPIEIVLQLLQISVVIPTCNRRERLVLLLQNLNQLSYPLQEVIVVDSGSEKLLQEEYLKFNNLRIQYIDSEQSVCIQRNKGIQKATSPWIFLCDDDIEMPADYLDILTSCINENKNAGAVSGIWLQQEQAKWVPSYPVRSGRMLLWKFIFQQGIWGEIEYAGKNPIILEIKKNYQRKGNHISKAGWPVNTNFSGGLIECPVNSLGASLVKREWLLQSPFDEVLDRYGIGDNYGVIAGFPFPKVYVTNKTSAYHHREPTNRLKSSLQYYRRVLALDYFRRVGKTQGNVRKSWLVWSLTGNGFSFLIKGQIGMAWITMKAIAKILLNRNPYIKADKLKRKVAEPKP